MNLKAFIKPNSILIVGGSDKLSSVGGITTDRVKKTFKGRLGIVNPKPLEIENIDVYHKISEINVPYELAIIAIKKELALEAMEDLGKKGIKNIILFAASFGEVGDEMAQSQLKKVIADYELQVIGPNCMGVGTPEYFGIFAGPFMKMSDQSPVFISQSGAFASFLEELALMRGIGFNSLWSLGNSIQIMPEDVLEYYATQEVSPSSRIFVLYIESIKDPQRLIHVARMLERKGCRIVALKSGRTAMGSDAAASHTAAMMTSEDAVNAIFRKAGILRATHKTHLLNILTLLILGKNKRVNRDGNTVVISHAGGPAILCIDALAQHQVSVKHLSHAIQQQLEDGLLPGSAVANPVDILATGGVAQLQFTLETLEKSRENNSAYIVIFGNAGFVDVAEVYQYLIQKIKSSSQMIIPVLPSVTTVGEIMQMFREENIPYFIEETDVASAMETLLQQPELYAYTPYELPQEEGTCFWLSTEEALQWMEQSHISIPAYRWICPDEIEDVAWQGPVALKLISQKMLHKSDQGGVEIVKTEPEFQAALVHMQRLAKQINDPECKILLQSLCKGHELIMGVKYEAGIGHLITVGEGGIYAEIRKDFSTRLLPIAPQEADEMIEEMVFSTVLKGYRGNPVNLESIKNTILKVSNLVQLHPEIMEMDINPFMVDIHGGFAVDVRIRVRK